MNDDLSDELVRQALKECAREPAHTPGTIQPFGCIVAIEQSSGEIHYVSANTAETIGREPQDLLGQNVHDIFGSDIWHNLKNVQSMSNFADKRHFVSAWENGDQHHALHVSKGGDYFIVEIEDVAEIPAANAEALRQQEFLLSQINSCSDQAQLFDLATQLLRHVTGFDRVMIYKFDDDWNGEILSEAARSDFEPYLGLRFPHWDIPEQARALMQKLDLRIISDVDQAPVPILADSDERPPLDIALAQNRGASPVHLQYLRNMGTAATMTLSVVLNGSLWGMISFHHGSPKVLSAYLRQILTGGILRVFCLKLQVLQKQLGVDVSFATETGQAGLHNEMEGNFQLEDLLAKVGPTVCEQLDVCGLCVVSGTQTYSYGKVPSQAVIEALMGSTSDANLPPLAYDALSQSFPDLKDDLGNIAGALIVAVQQNRSVITFREELKTGITWAGNPNKTIEKMEGIARLQPRASFSRYLELQQGKSKPWTKQEIHLAMQLWPLLSPVERQSFMTALNRQQELLIGELNHRVRNILALVKSVSQQARREGGSLEDYGQALEARIHALAAAHEVGTDSLSSAVSVRKIIDLEVEPYLEAQGRRVEITGTDFKIRADQAPIFALVMHEMMTNAVKFGALSIPSGRIKIDIKHEDAGMSLTWIESGGPVVTEPERKGFGTTLITQALPFEMQGKTELAFLPGGVQARHWLPMTNLTLKVGDDELAEPSEQNDSESSERVSVDHRPVLILEDNFVIAHDLAAIMTRLGFPNCETLARASEALDYLETQRPALAILDINLGHGQTSETVAKKLFELGVPLIFASGYADQVMLPIALDEALVITKPVAEAELKKALARLAV